MEVLRISKQNWPTGKVVIFSGYVSPGIRDYCVRLGADAVFNKAQSADFIGAWY